MFPLGFLAKQVTFVLAIRKDALTLWGKLPGGMTASENRLRELPFSFELSEIRATGAGVKETPSFTSGPSLFPVVHPRHSDFLRVKILEITCAQCPWEDMKIKHSTY